MEEFIEHELTCNEHMKIYGNESHFYKCRPDHPEFHDCHPDMTWNEVNVSTTYISSYRVFHYSLSSQRKRGAQVYIYL